MTHEECLNKILANACPCTADNDTDVHDYIIELHCVCFRVTARYLGNFGTDEDTDDFRYEILKLEKL